MLHLVTGANGAGKTLNTLKWVRERQLKETRPVCHNGRFEPVEGGEISTWKKIDFKDWQAEPDGTIFLVDECHNDMPVRQAGSATPEHIKMLAEHRRRGMDFYLVTQHPQNIDSFVRRLIGSPGWHRHLKRTFGADLVRCIEWAAVNPNCEKDGSGKTGSITTVPFPKDVYGWYKSASLHTGKRKIPKMVWVLVVALLVVILGGWYGIKTLRQNIEGPQGTGSKASAPSGGQQQAKAGPMTTAEYLDHRKPRLPDFPHTAPAYDDVTKPTEAPYPAACVQMGKTCKCYTQQATLLQVSGAVCLQIVQQGFFMDWKTAQRGEFSPRDRGEYRQQREALPQAQQVAQVDSVRTVPAPMPAARPEPPQSQYLQGLAARNAQVRSSLTQ
ncbi:zona occludens toxin [Acidovorax sp. 107]|uniref:zonular occludens toxin domain-containing protein n=1 Tax=Acidovorax sp. 107 TaxID=2135638 RepID=UPI000D389E24|nr:zonular occludens toxin domain-containing protein [Acidovorax sp. 107]PUA96084.1 zona occludens toxin [Acidovorax sp. 107]